MKKTLIALAIIATTTGLTACGGSSGSTSAPTPAPTNKAPTDITLSNAAVDENAVGAVIGDLAAVDSDAGDTHTFTVDNDSFVIADGKLVLAEGQSLDFESSAEITVNVTATDNGNLSFSKAFTITVNDIIEAYEFTNANTGNSSVSYSGQTARHVLIAELNYYLANTFTNDVKNGVLTSKQAVLDKLNSFYSQSAEEYELTKDQPLTAFSGTVQKTLGDISSSHKNLIGKVAGRDHTGQHKNWDGDVDGDGVAEATIEFAGWGTKGVTTPVSLINELFDMLATNAENYLAGNVSQDINGQDIAQLYITEDGRDLKQLVQKFLLGAVAYSQAADDYLDTGVEGKGLQADNVNLVEGKDYTSLEHQIDEGFGYFGAARDYLSYTDDELSQKGGRDDWQGKHDSNGDGEIDLFAEYNFGNSTNAAKRDRGTVGNANPTDYSTKAFNAFLALRNAAATRVGQETSQSVLAGMNALATAAMGNWERAIVATVIHYINDSRADLSAIGTDAFSYTDLAKHWSEMKGFALGLQFNPKTPLTTEQFEQLHTLLADKPVISGTEAIEAYRAQLLEARNLLQEAYAFDAENVEKW